MYCIRDVEFGFSWEETHTMEEALTAKKQIEKEFPKYEFEITEEEGN